MIRKMLPNFLVGRGFRVNVSENARIFDQIIGYEGIKRTFIRSLNSKKPVHFLLGGPPGQAKTMFLKCILEAFGREAFFTVGGTASKSGLMDVLFDLRPKYLLIDEIEHLKAEYQTPLLSLMEKVMKIAAVVIGLFVAALAYLSYRGWVDVKWAAMEDALRSTVTNASEQVVNALNNTTTQFASHPSVVAASGLPIAATFGFVPGVMIGFRKG
jgi:uncharacterized membrane protein (Fun14 family)